MSTEDALEFHGWSTEMITFEEKKSVYVLWLAWALNDLYMYKKYQIVNICELKVMQGS